MIIIIILWRVKWADNYNVDLGFRVYNLQRADVEHVRVKQIRLFVSADESVYNIIIITTTRSENRRKSFANRIKKNVLLKERTALVDKWYGLKSLKLQAYISILPICKNRHNN